VLALASTHLVVDTYNNIFAPLLPLLIPRMQLSLAMVGTLAMCFQLATSVAQLGFGALADRWRPRVLLVWGPVLSVVVLSTIGTATSPLMLAAILLVGGLGGAAFHPPAAALVNEVSGQRKGFAMSVHITGGQVGFSLAPILFAPVIMALGLRWSWLVAIPGLMALAFTLRLLPPMHHAHKSTGGGWSVLKPYRKPLAMLYAIVVLRTFTAYSFSTFMAVLLTSEGMSVAEASFAVSLYLFSTSIGVFLGGPMADLYGPRRVIIWSLLAAMPFMIAAPLTHGWTLAIIASLGGFLLQSTLPVNVTYAHQIAPVSAATVSSLMMGFAWGTGALMVPVVGLLADRLGLAGALVAVAGAPIIAVAVALKLPEVRGSRHSGGSMDSSGSIGSVGSGPVSP
jgi:FSR family fosmidomycin resistance protein-like MFS transporter